MVAKNLALIAVFSPLLGFFCATLLSIFNIDSRYDKQKDALSQWITCLLMIMASLASLFLVQEICLSQNPQTLTLLPWINVGDFKASWGFRLDSISVIMMAMVTFVSFLIHIYSIGYMSHDTSIPRFMGYLSLFTFMMLMLITAPNLLQLFFGWEGVGLASYLLIGFWYERPAANRASIKAFLVNRVGDIGLALGIAATFAVFHTIEFNELFTHLISYGAHIPDGSFSIEYVARPMLTLIGYQWDALTIISILFIIGAMGKSAQLGLHTWLPDAMEGPTPVSALIHAATMVTAGVFLLCRLSPLYELVPLARDILIFVGAATALFAASVAITQTDIKRIIAYSTCSQLGYMVFAVGCSAYHAALYHLIAHAFFKALLFLGAGSVIHALSDEQNINRMGGISKLIPLTYGAMWIGSLQLCAIPIFTLYQSKDTIIEFAFLKGTPLGYFAFAIGVFVAFLTALYSWKLLIVAFQGTFQGNKKTKNAIHESSPSMLIPLGILSVGAFVIGYLGYGWFIGDQAHFIWHGALPLQPHPEHIPLWVVLAPVVAALLGIGVAYYLYGGLYERFTRQKKGIKSLPDQLSQQFKKLYDFLYNKWYIDDLYDFLFVKKVFGLGDTHEQGDRDIDRFGPDGASTLSIRISQWMTQLQTGYVYHYAFAMIVGILLMVALYQLQNLYQKLHIIIFLIGRFLMAIIVPLIIFILFFFTVANLLSKPNRNNTHDN